MKLSPVTSRSSGVPVSPTEPLDHAAKSEFERAMGTQQPTRHDALQAHQHLLHTALGAKKPAIPTREREGLQKKDTDDANPTSCSQQEITLQQPMPHTGQPAQGHEKTLGPLTQKYNDNRRGAEQLPTAIPSGRERAKANLKTATDVPGDSSPRPHVGGASDTRSNVELLHHPAGNKADACLPPRDTRRTSPLQDEFALPINTVQTPGDKLLSTLQGTAAPQAVARDLTQLIETLQVHLQSRSSSGNTTVLHITLPTLGAVEVKLAQAAGQLQIDFVTSTSSLLPLQLARADLLERLQKLNPEHSVTLQFSDAQQDSKHGSRQRRHVFEERDDLA
ncbi:type III secretion system needle length determinant [Pseudomonas plecoglossicida]|uniref:Type III secretion system needle length determinant n=1 Tax=Pseudomonas plecoglossicida TaxID=70775 RepID=A0AAD0QVJ7_PSEDL|nr:type III secretion system needle length determinant [Pseudomonas plecoglossicida]AXM95545.1 type III secretion system needle length determinant [Pseudomonas plecoglossicida]QLB56292.1 type III secretion system needle length determinant [Pseudomonas plecoglossicida]